MSTGNMKMPFPANQEWLVWFVVEIVYAVVWIASSSVTGSTFVTMTAITTLGYLISRGIAKAGKVQE